jgi:hypothetical protein
VRVPDYGLRLCQYLQIICCYPVTICDWSIILRFIIWLAQYMLLLLLASCILVTPTWSIEHPWNASFHFSFLIEGSRLDSMDEGSARRKDATWHKHEQTSMPWVGFEPTIPAFGRANTFNALNRAALKYSGGPEYNRLLIIRQVETCCLQKLKRDSISKRSTEQWDRSNLRR